jgi:transcriptional regulator with XRE-family HTH domain
MFGANPQEVTSLVVRANLALGLSQRQFAERLSSSLRTVSRWTAGKSYPSNQQLRLIVQLVYPRDPAIAAALARATGATVEELVPHAGAAVAPRRAPLPLLLDNVVHAAAEAMDLSPRLARRGLAAAFARARELGVTLEEAAQGLDSPPARD